MIEDCECDDKVKLRIFCVSPADNSQFILFFDADFYVPKSVHQNIIIDSWSGEEKLYI